MHYHISDVEGLTELEPHVPEGAYWGEPDIPRVCASSDIEQCLLSLVDVGLSVEIVYAIDRKPDVDNASVINWPEGGEVDDAPETGEVWYLTSVACREVARIVRNMAFREIVWEV